MFTSFKCKKWAYEEVSIYTGDELGQHLVCLLLATDAEGRGEHTLWLAIRGPGHNKSHGIMVKLIRMNNATKPYPATPDRIAAQAEVPQSCQLQRFW